MSYFEILNYIDHLFKKRALLFDRLTFSLVGFKDRIPLDLKHSVRTSTGNFYKDMNPTLIINAVEIYIETLEDKINSSFDNALEMSIYRSLLKSSDFVEFSQPKIISSKSKKDIQINAFMHNVRELIHCDITQTDNKSYTDVNKLNFTL